MSLNFYSVNKLPKDVFTPSGSEVIPDYHEIIDDRGCNVLEICGEKNIQAEIQSYKESTDMASIVKRMLDLGVDFGAVPVEIEDDVVDVSDVQTKSNQELLNALNKMEQNMKLFEEYKSQIEAEKKAKEEVTNNE